jgi:hypothetical protein
MLATAEIDLLEIFKAFLKRLLFLPKIVVFDRIKQDTIGLMK